MSALKQKEKEKDVEEEKGQINEIKMMKADKYVELVVESFDNEESKAPRAPTPARDIEEEKKEAPKGGNASP